MSAFLLAVPSEAPGGLEAQTAQHFGHCELYTLVEIDGDAVKHVETLPNLPHHQGGCMAPVQYLADRGVKKMLAGGMGMRPLMGFKQAGIDVFYVGKGVSVGAAVQDFLAGRLQPFSTEYTCGGHH